MSVIRKIAVLTSGGDAPGMNPAIRGVVRTALSMGVKVVGVRRGYQGLMEGDIFEMDYHSVSNIIALGGTVLKSARSPEFRNESGMQKALKVCRDNEIDGIVVIGGDGSFRGARDFTAHGVNCIGVSGTIDNDISSSDYTTGYDTSLNTIVEMTDRIRDTMESHGRCMVVETMGRNAGYLALNGGIACGAVAILVPEIAFDIELDVIQRIKMAQSKGETHFIVMVAEGCSPQFGGVDALAKQIEAETDIESRSIVLGHIQRGGSPTLKDRVVGTRLGNYAAHLLIGGAGNRVVTFNKDEISDMDINEALAMTKEMDKDLYRVAREVTG